MPYSSTASTGRSGAARATTARTTASGGEAAPDAWQGGRLSSKHPLLSKPPHRILEGRLGSSPAIAELADGLVAREVHAVPCHAHALDRDPRGAPGKAREALG